MSKSSCKIVDFFMGANTSEGFHSYFGGFDPPKPGFRRYLIKGGPGTGKSHMMKQVMAAAMQENLPGVLERIHCSSDADSLDAFLWEAKRCAVFDATPPHAVEPKFPGAYDRVIPITACWDDDMLEAAQAPIVELSRRISRLHERCQVLLSAQNMLYLQNQLSLSGYWQEEKLRRSSLAVCQTAVVWIDPVGTRGGKNPDADCGHQSGDHHLYRDSTGIGGQNHLY